MEIYTLWPFITDIVKSGLKVRFAEEPAQNICQNIPVTNAEKQIISDEKTPTKRGYVSLHERGGWFCHPYLPEKKGMGLTEWFLT